MGPRLRTVDGLCCGFGNCELLCPAIFKLDAKEGRVELVQRLVPAEYLTHVRQAVDECPTRAIELIQEEVPR